MSVPLVFGDSASGTARTWSNSSGGSASTITNWSPIGTPVTADDLTFSLSAAYTVTFPSSTLNDHAHFYKHGAVTLTMSSPHTTNSGFRIGDAATDNAAVILTTGNWNVNATSFLGKVNGALGTLAVNDDDANLVLGGATTDLIVGDDGTGTLSVSGGGYVSTGRDIVIANTINSVGHVTVSGAQLGIPSWTSKLQTNDGDLVVGGSGSATLDITGGAVVLVGGSAYLGRTSLGDGRLTIGSTNPLFNSLLHVDGDMKVGQRGSAIPPPPESVLTVDSGGVVTIDGTLGVGNSISTADQWARLTIQGDGSLTCGGLNVGSHGELDISRINGDAGGKLTIIGGDLNPPGEYFRLSGAAGARPVVELNGADCETPFPANGLGFDIGSSGNVELRLLNGSGLYTGGYALFATFGQALMTLDGGSSFDVPYDDLYIGYQGAGQVNVLGGSFIRALNLLLATQDGGDNTIDVSGIGSQVLVTGQLLIDDTAGLQDGIGRLNFENGSSGQVTGSLVRIGRTGILHIGSGASFNTSATTNLDNRGTIDLDAGTLMAGNGLIMNTESVLSGIGVVEGPIDADKGTFLATDTGIVFRGLVTRDTEVINTSWSGTRFTFDLGGGFTGLGSIGAEVMAFAGSTITATGNLTMGLNSSASGVTLNGTLVVGQNTVILNDSGTVNLGALTTINGGQLMELNGGVIVDAGDILRGAGMVFGHFTNNGMVEPGFPADTVGTLNGAGRYTQGAAGDLKIDVSGPASADLLHSAQQTVLAGDLLVNMLNNYAPALNQEFTILTAQSVTGTFTNVIPSNLKSCLDVQVVYGSNNVKIRFVANTCPADIAPAGGNNQVNIDDLVQVITHWGTCPAGFCAGDIAPSCGNGQVNIDDLVAVVTSWGACP